MGVVLTFLAVAAGYGLVMLGLVKLGLRARRRGIASSIMSVYDEIWHPVAHQPQQEIRVQRERLSPRQTPGDPPLDDPTPDDPTPNADRNGDD